MVLIHSKVIRFKIGQVILKISQSDSTEKDLPPWNKLFLTLFNIKINVLTIPISLYLFWFSQYEIKSL